MVLQTLSSSLVMVPEKEFHYKMKHRCPLSMAWIDFSVMLQSYGLLLVHSFHLQAQNVFSSYYFAMTSNSFTNENRQDQEGPSNPMLVLYIRTLYIVGSILHIAYQRFLYVRSRNIHQTWSRRHLHDLPSQSWVWWVYVSQHDIQTHTCRLEHPHLNTERVKGN